MSVVAWKLSYVTGDRIMFCNEQTESKESQSTAQIFEEYIPVECLYPLPYTGVGGKRQKELSNIKSKNIFICIILLMFPLASLVFTLVFSALSHQPLTALKCH